MATIKVVRNIITLAFCIMTISNCDEVSKKVHTLNYGMKQYTFVSDRIETQYGANSACKSSYGSTLAVIIDAVTLQKLNDWLLFSLKSQFVSNDAIHELWVGGKSNGTNNWPFDLEQSQPLENGIRCLSLSNSTHPDLSKGYHLYNKECSGRRQYLCEKTRDLVVNSTTFGRLPRFDSNVIKFNDHHQTSMLSKVTIYEYRDDLYRYISCIGFTYGYEELPCRGNHAFTENKHILELGPEEYITEVSGEQSWGIRLIMFKTNLKRTLGPVGKSSGFGQFKVSHNGAPLLFVSGSAGVWLYQIQFHFFYTGVDDLKHVSNEIASKVHIAVKDAELKKLVDINKQYQHMLPDVAAKGCNIYLLRHDNNYVRYEAACTLRFLLEQLNVYTISTDGLKKHLPRDLMPISDYNSVTLLEVVTDAKRFHTLLSKVTFTIKDVGSKIQDTVTNVTQDLGNNLKQYFSKVADFDKKIALADREYVTEKLDKLTAESANLMTDLNTRTYAMLSVAVAATAVDAVEAGIKLAAAIVTSFNPLGWLFGSQDPTKIADRVAELSKAIRHAVHARKLLETLDLYAQYMKGLSHKFASNKIQIDVMEKVILTFPTASESEQAKLAEEFVEKYNDYVPQVSSHEIGYAVDLLSAVIGEGCGLIAGTSGTIANILHTFRHLIEFSDTFDQKEPATICTELQPLLSKLRAMYQSVFNFQFELIGSFTRIVRANIAHTMAGQISNINPVKGIDLRTAVIGSLMVEIRSQAVTHARCQELEYLNGGNRPDICKHIHFTDSLIDKVIAYEGTIQSSPITKFAFIPTTSSSTDRSSPYLDVADLIANNVTYFQLPLNDEKWMVKYKWLPESYYHPNHEKQTSYFMKRMELFIPGLKCNGLNDYNLKIDIVSGNNVNLYIQTAPPSYVIPKALYRFIYNKRETCPSDAADFEVRKDDAELSYDHQQSVCVLSNGENNSPLPPSLYSTWIIKLLTPEGCDPVMDSSLGFSPLVSVRITIKEVIAGDMNDCWPPPSRCELDERCVDGILSYTCQRND